MIIESLLRHLKDFFRFERLSLSYRSKGIQGYFSSAFNVLCREEKKGTTIDGWYCQFEASY